MGQHRNPLVYIQWAQKKSSHCAVWDNKVWRQRNAGEREWEIKVPRSKHSGGQNTSGCFLALILSISFSFTARKTCWRRFLPELSIQFLSQPFQKGSEHLWTSTWAVYWSVALCRPQQPTCTWLVAASWHPANKPWVEKYLAFVIRSFRGTFVWWKHAAYKKWGQCIIHPPEKTLLK